jgi:branched-chain amino acid transport system permease protein
MGSVTGAILSALTLSLALEGLRAAQQYRMVMYSVLLIVLMLTRPAGIFGTREIWDLFPRLFRRRGAPPPGTPEPGTGSGGRLS